MYDKPMRKYTKPCKATIQVADDNHILTNREVFRKVFGCNIEEYHGWNDEFIIKNLDGVRFSAKWLDAEYRPRKVY